MMENISDIEVVMHDSGDWVGLYIDGQLKLEGHDICWEDLFFLLKIDYQYHTVSDEFLVNHRMPDNLPEEL